MQRGSSRLKASTFLNSSSNLCTKPSSVAALSRLSLLAETSAKKREMGLGTKPKLKSKLSSMEARWCCGVGLGDFLWAKLCSHKSETTIPWFEVITKEGVKKKKIEIHLYIRKGKLRFRTKRFGARIRVVASLSHLVTPPCLPY